jgi:photosystem II stability/assembly factor-like uncharacterized protein
LNKVAGLSILLFMLSQVSSAQWVQTSGPTGSSISVLAADGSNLFAGTNYGDLFLSTDEGANWTSITSAFPSYYVDSISKRNTGYRFSSLAINGSSLVVNSKLGIFYSKDNGASWSPVNYGSPSTVYDLKCFAICLDGTGGTEIFAGSRCQGIVVLKCSGTSLVEADSSLPYECIFSLVVSGTNIFAGGETGTMAGAGVFRSVDNGATWTPVDSGLPYVPIELGILPAINSIGVCGSDLYAATMGQGVYKSKDSGATWSYCGLESNYASCFAAGSSVPGETNIFAGAMGGVFVSSNGGISWAPINSGLPSCNVNSFAITNLNLFANTTAGIWQLPLSTVAVIKDPNSTNHAQSQLKISFSSSYVSFVLPAKTGSIAIYDIRGRIIERMQVVDQAAIWPGNHAAGRYLAAVISSRETFVRPFVVTR